MCFSSSKQSNEVTNKTEQFDERIGASDEAIVIQLQDGAQVSISDTQSGEIATLAFEEFGNVLDETLGFTKDELAAERDLVERSLELVEKRTQSETLTISQQAVRLAAVAGVAVVALQIAPKILR